MRKRSVLIKKVESQDELKAIVKALKAEFSDPTGFPVLADAGLMFFRGCNTFVGIVNDVYVTLNSTHFGKKKKNTWEPYANWYIAYTRYDHRRQGYAKGLATEVRRRAVEAGCVRLKSLAGSQLGYELHRSFGDQFWAKTLTLELAVDTPLVTSDWLVEQGRQPFPEETPINVRQLTTRTRPLTLDKIETYLASGLRYDLKKKA